jgi:hypothetical protein
MAGLHEEPGRRAKIAGNRKKSLTKTSLEENLS